MYNESKIPEVANSLDSFERDCAITLALKIADDTCKMDEYERSIFMKVYDAIIDKKSDYFDKNVFDIIEEGRKSPSAQIYAKIKPIRQAAMDMVTRPKMKAFKAGVRERLY